MVLDDKLRELLNFSISFGYSFEQSDQIGVFECYWVDTYKNYVTSYNVMKIDVPISKMEFRTRILAQTNMLQSYGYV